MSRADIRGAHSQASVQDNSCHDVRCYDWVGKDAAELLCDGERVNDDALATGAISHLPQLKSPAVSALDGHQGHSDTEEGGEEKDS